MAEIKYLEVHCVRQAKPISLKINYLYSIVYQLLTIIIPIVTTPYVSRILQPDGIGAYSYTFSIVTYFGMFGTLGISTYGQLKIAAERDHPARVSRSFWELFIARIVTMTAASAVYLVFAWTSPKYGVLYIILFIYLISQAFDVSWALQGQERFKVTVSANLIIKIISTVLIFILIKQKSDLFKYVLLLQGATLAANISMWPALKRSLIPVNIHTIRFYRHWRASLVYFIPTVATSVYTVLDKSMLGWLTGSDFQNGYYEQAHKIEQLLVAVVTSLGTVTLPRISYLYKEKKYDSIRDITDTTLQYILFISIPMCLSIIAIAPTLVAVFLGPGYGPCVSILRVFAALIVIVGLNNTIGKQCLMPTGRQKSFNIGVIAGALLNVALNMVLIPKLSATGAAIASDAAEMVILCIFIYYSRDYLNFKKLGRYSFRYLVIAFIMSIGVVLVGKCLGSTVRSLIIQILFGTVLYTVLLLLLKDKMIKKMFRILKVKRN